MNIILIDKRAVLQCLGCLIKQPSLMEEHLLEVEDFYGEAFYQIIFSCINNLYIEGISKIDAFAIDTKISELPKQYEIFEKNNGLKYCQDAVELSDIRNFGYYYDKLKKLSCLRYWESQGLNTKDTFDYSVTDPSKIEEENQKLSSMTVDEIIEKYEYVLIDSAKSKFSLKSRSRGQTIGKGLKKLKESLKLSPEFGLPLQSLILTTIFRGMRKRKLYMRSASSGGGKVLPSLLETIE